MKIRGPKQYVIDCRGAMGIKVFHPLGVPIMRESVCCVTSHPCHQANWDLMRSPSSICWLMQEVGKFYPSLHLMNIISIRINQCLRWLGQIMNPFERTLILNWFELADVNAHWAWDWGCTMSSNRCMMKNRGMSGLNLYETGIQKQSKRRWKMKHTWTHCKSSQIQRDWMILRHYAKQKESSCLETCPFLLS